MKLLVFEYSCVEYEKHLFAEGYDMLNQLLTDLNELTSFEVFYLVNSKIPNLEFSNCCRITVDGDLMKWLEENSKKFEYCLFIAPENDFIQYSITRILEDNNVELINSDSDSSYVCCSKDLTYKKLPDEILKIHSKIININDANAIINETEFNKNGVIVKPDDKTSTESIYHVKKIEEIGEILEKYKKEKIEKAIIQEYIPGLNVSASLLVNKKRTQFISLNLQHISENRGQLKYDGCTVPVTHPLIKKIKWISQKIIKEMPGLKGFVGIDFIIQKDKIYFVEINSRITTPFILLSKNCEENLTEQMMNFVLKNKENNVNIIRKEKYILRQ